MKLRLYPTLKKIHLYASLATLVFFFMYILTSFMMVHHHTFAPGEPTTHSQTLSIQSDELEGDRWGKWLAKHGVHGRLENEKTSDEGELIRVYETPGSAFTLTLSENREEIRLESSKRDLAGTLNEFHRLRGYKGPFSFWLYALMIDLTAIALILFAITGIILWLNMLKQDKLAWGILLSGIVYVGAVMYALM